jgi:hypothetical protein
VDFGEHIERGTGFRALASAQHPIALGAALVMVIPITVYLHRRDDRFIWLACGGILTLGALATGSRTATLMLLSLLATFLWLKRKETVRLIPMLIPLAIVIQIGMPGTLGTLRALLNPTYVVQEQSRDVGTGSGRIADLGPSLSEWSQTPFLGQGFGTRVVAVDLGPGGVGDPSRAQILDDQWLGTLLEIGAFGVFALAWLFIRSIRRLGARARSDPGIDGWLMTAIAASLTSFAVGMFTFDAFAFIQVTFLAFIMLGFMAVALRDTEPQAARP